MAVYAAHLTRTLEGAPSVFTVVAQDALGATVKPALGKLVEYLAAVYPNKLGWCVHWYDELFLVVDCFLQYHYLKHYAASFSESFYGLVRAPVRASAEFHSGGRLPRATERASLALLALLPYCRDRLQRLVDRWREDHEDGKLGTGPGARARRVGVHVHSAAHAAAALAALLQLARHVRGAASPTPALALLGLTLRAAPAPQPEGTWGDLARSLLAGRFGSAALTFPMLGGLALRAAEYGAFAVQFLRWWAAAAPAPPSAPCPPPPPPPPPATAPRGNRCPVCLQPWKTPTALPVSGLVYCYGCISRELRARGACPATRLPAREDQLRRIYVD